MKRILTFALAAMLWGTTASADDRTTASDWNGLYVGGTIGGGWGTSRLSSLDPDSSGDFDVDGVLGGVTLGFNHHQDMIVFGVESDYVFSDMSGDASGAFCISVCTAEIKWLATVRGRVGLALGRYMPFFTGGLAIGEVDGSVNGEGLQSETRVGLTFGGGVEFQVTDWISIKGEYLFVDLGRAQSPFDFVDGGIVSQNADSNHIIRGGVNNQLGNLFGPR